MQEYHLSIDEETSQVSFSSQTLSGAKAGLAELKRRKRLYVIQKKVAFAKVREERVLYRGHQAIGRFPTSGKDLFGGLMASIANFCNSMRRIKQFKVMAHSEFDVSKTDRVIAAIDLAIIKLESEMTNANSR